MHPFLPAGLEVEVEGGTARLRFASHALRAAYCTLTQPDASPSGPGSVRISRYLWSRWKRELGPELWTLLTTLQELGAGRELVLSLDRLAAECGLSLPSVRRYLCERYRDPETYASPGWRAFRTYVCRIEEVPNGGGPGTKPYRFVLLQGDVPHPEDYPWLEAMVAVPEERTGWGALRFTDEPYEMPPVPPAERPTATPPATRSERRVAPTPGPEGPGADSIGLLTAGSAQTERQPESQEGAPAAPLPPCTPHPRALHAGMHARGTAAQPASGSGAAGAVPRLTGEALPELRRTLAQWVHPDVAQYLTSTPEKARWAARWAEWFPFVRHRIRSPRRFLITRVEGAVAGDQDYQVPPSEYLDHLEGGRTGGGERSRPAPPRPARPPFPKGEERSAASPGRGETPLAPELAEVWREFRAACGAAGLLPCDLVDARPERLEGGRLVIRLASRTHVEKLNRRKGQLLKLAAREGCLFSELQFLGPEGAPLRESTAGARSVAA